MYNKEKLCYLLTEEWKETATFLDKAWYLRTQIMYFYYNWGEGIDLSSPSRPLANSDNL